MKNGIRLALVCLLALTAGMGGSAQGPTRSTTGGTWFPDYDSGPVPESNYVVLCKITGEIDDGIAVVVERAVKSARNASALIFVIDTPGGRVDSAIEITRHIMNAACPTYAYVEGMGAISAGAIISYACDHIVMGPATNIGASTPISMGPEGAVAVDEKSMSFVRAKYRALGEEKGHNPLIGEAMVDKEIVLYGFENTDGSYTTYKVENGTVTDTFTEDGSEDKFPVDAPLGVAQSGPAMPVAPVGLMALPHAQSPQSQPRGLPDIVRELVGEPPKPPVVEESEEENKPEAPVPMEIPAGAELICSGEKLLTLTTAEALRFRLTALKADNVDQLLSYYGDTGSTKHYIVPTLPEALFAWLTSPMIAGLLLMLGIGGLYIEIRTPGFGVPGMIGATCLALFFGSYLVLGIADWVDIILVGIGIALLLIEIFVLPGFGFVGVGGLVCMLAGFYLAMVRNPIPQYEWDFSRLSDVTQTLMTTFVLFTGLMILTWKLFPRTPMAGWLVLREAQTANTGYVVQTDEQERLAEGLEGEASSMLRPAGRARFEGKNYDVVTRGEFIEPHTRVRIIRADGNRYVVEAVR